MLFLLRYGSNVQTLLSLLVLITDEPLKNQQCFRYRQVHPGSRIKSQLELSNRLDNHFENMIHKNHKKGLFRLLL